MLSFYREKRDYFTSLLCDYLQGKVNFEVPKGGLAFWLTPSNQKDLYKIKEKANKLLLNFYTPDRFSFAEPVCGLRLGYASLSENDLEKGIDILRRCL